MTCQRRRPSSAQFSFLGQIMMQGVRPSEVQGRGFVAARNGGLSSDLACAPALVWAARMEAGKRQGPAFDLPGLAWPADS